MACPQHPIINKQVSFEIPDLSYLFHVVMCLPTRSMLYYFWFCLMLLVWDLGKGESAHPFSRSTFVPSTRSQQSKKSSGFARTIMCVKYRKNTLFSEDRELPSSRERERENMSLKSASLASLELVIYPPGWPLTHRSFPALASCILSAGAYRLCAVLPCST